MPVKQCEAGMIMACGIDDLLEHSESSRYLTLVYTEQIYTSLGFMVFNFIPLNVLFTLVLGGVDFYMEDSILPQFFGPGGECLSMTGSQACVPLEYSPKQYAFDPCRDYRIICTVIPSKATGCESPLSAPQGQFNYT